MIPYIGGKSYLASWIISRFPKNYTDLQYCEVFGGGGWVLFKKELSVLETYNDLNKNIVNLFKIIRDNFEEFSYKSEWTLHSREMYEEARNRLKDDRFVNDLERAMHYSINKIQSFSANGGWAYGVTAPKILSGKWLPFLKRLSIINARLKRVQIECLDFESLIIKYDNKNTLFYLDPPYVGVEHYYNRDGVNFGMKDHERLHSMLKNIKGKFVLSYYDHSLVKKLYKGFNWKRKTSVKHSLGCTRNYKLSKKPKSKEVLILNY